MSGHGHTMFPAFHITMQGILFTLPVLLPSPFNSSSPQTPGRILQVLSSPRVNHSDLLVLYVAGVSSLETRKSSQMSHSPGCSWHSASEQIRCLVMLMSYDTAGTWPQFRCLASDIMARAQYRK